MDQNRFDTLTRSLTTTGSCRRALIAVLSGALAPLVAREDTGAHNPLLTCKKLKGEKKKKCLKRAKRHNTQHAREAPPPGPTCTDGVQNGSETGVDCGGACPRCASGQGCTARNDCASAFCSEGTCQTCTDIPDNCDSDADGPCFCRTHPDGGKVCIKNVGTGSCQNSACPPGSICITYQGSRYCYEPCGAP